MKKKISVILLTCTGLITIFIILFQFSWFNELFAERVVSNNGTAHGQSCMTKTGEKGYISFNEENDGFVCVTKSGRIPMVE